MKVSYPGQGSGSASNAGGGAYIFRPGGEPGGNVYDDFGDAYEAASAIKPGSIILDPTEEAVVIPAGTYNLTNIPLIGYAEYVSPPITIADGVHFTGRSFWASNLAITSNATSALWAVTSGGLIMILTNDVSFTSPDGPIVSLANASTSLILEAHRFCFLFNAGFPFVQAGAGTTADLYAMGAAASFYEDTGAGAGTFTVHNMLEGITGEGAPFISPTAVP